MRPTLTAGNAGDERDFTSDALPHDDIPVATTAVMLPPVEGLCCERDAKAGSRRVRGAPLILNVPAAPSRAAGGNLLDAVIIVILVNNQSQRCGHAQRPRSLTRASRKP